MEKKYINENRYKKSINRKHRNISAIRKGKSDSNSTKINNVKKINKKKKKARVKPSVRMERKIRRRNIFVIILLIVAIAILLRALLKEEGEPFIPIFTSTEKNEQIITVGVITEESLLSSNINNVVLKELECYTNHMLLSVNSDYTLNYDIIRDIKKLSDTEIEIYINESKEYDASSIKRVLDGYRSNTSSKYYNDLREIKEIYVLNEQTFKIILNSSNPYFVYKLQIPIVSTNKKQYEKTADSNENMIEYVRTKYASDESIAKIIVKRYKDMYQAVEAYKKGTINMLITNQKNVQNILGKYEYNLKTYRNGDSIFLFLNQSSEWVKNEEIRKVIAYGIDRESVAKNIMQSAANIIDLPYIYDEVKYKYDIYAAENLLLSNGYKKTSGIYNKNGKKLSLSLLVNKADKEKVDIATVIKNNLSAIGVQVNIEKLSVEDIEKKVESGKYDLVLSSVKLNSYPNINFLKSSLYITEELEQSMIKSSEVELGKLPEQIKNISNTMSNSVSCIGIVAKTNYVVYSKEIAGVGDIFYLKIFDNLIIK